MQFVRMWVTYLVQLHTHIGNRKQCLKLHWIFKQLKNSKITSEGGF